MNEPIAPHTHAKAVAGATLAMILVAVGTGLAATSGGVMSVPPEYRLPEFCALIALANSAAGYALGQWVIRHRLEALEKPVIHVFVDRREGATVITSRGDRATAVLSLSFLGAMFMPLVSLLFLFVPIVELVKGNKFDWFSWAAGFATLAGVLSVVGVIGAVLFAIPMVYARTVLELDSQQIVIRLRRLIPRFPRRIPPADIASVETWYGGIELKLHNGRSVVIGLSGTREEVAMIRDVMREAMERQ